MTIFAKNSILDIWQGAEYASGLRKLTCRGSILCSNDPDNKYHKHVWRMLFFTCIKLLARVLASAIALIKWRSLFCLILSSDCTFTVKGLYIYIYIYIYISGHIRDLYCLWLSNTASFSEHYAKFYFDVKYLEKGLSRGHFLRPFFQKSALFS